MFGIDTVGESPSRFKKDFFMHKLPTLFAFNNGTGAFLLSQISDFVI